MSRLSYRLQFSLHRSIPPPQTCHTALCNFDFISPSFFSVTSATIANNVSYCHPTTPNPEIPYLHEQISCPSSCPLSFVPPTAYQLYSAPVDRRGSTISTKSRGLVEKGWHFELVECFGVFFFGELFLRGLFGDLFLFGFGGGEVWLCHGSLGVVW